LSDVWLLALGLVLIFEGIMPMVAPHQWRRLFEQLLQMEEGQIRFFGLFMVLAGLILVWLMG
jgi:uncharacterized protein